MAKRVHQTGRKLKGEGKCDIGGNPDREDMLVLSAKEYLLVWIGGGRNVVDVFLAKEAIHYGGTGQKLCYQGSPVIVFLIGYRLADNKNTQIYPCNNPW